VLSTRVTVEAQFFGLAALIERSMESVAAESLEAFNAFAVSYMRDYAAAAQQQQRRGGPPKLTLEPASPRASSGAGAGAAGATPGTPGSPLTRAGSLKRRRGSSAPGVDEAPAAGSSDAAVTPAPGAAADEQAAATPADGSLPRSASLRRRTSGVPPQPARKC
jgi:hypothetical protein